MGIPGLYRNIIQVYDGIHFASKDLAVDCFYIDFNPIIYNCYHELVSKLGDKVLGQKDLEEELVDFIIRKTKQMICDHVKPEQLVYIAIDGPAPRAKMVKQRERRFKKIYEKKLLRAFRKRVGCEADYVKKWDTSRITPGSEFMYKLCTTLKESIRTRKFQSHIKEGRDFQIILSGSDVPGEGEHKFLNHIGSSDYKYKNIVIFSNDADLLMLANRFYGSQMYIMMSCGNSSQVFKDIYKDEEFVYIDVTKFQRAFIEELGLGREVGVRNVEVITDFIFYNMFAGNDFVQPIFFSKMRKRHTYGMLFFIYKKLVSFHRNPLIRYNRRRLEINHKFFVDFIDELAKQESFRLMKHQEFIVNYNSREHSGKMSDDDIEVLDDPEKIALKEFDEYQHMYYFDKMHPMFEEARETFNKFGFEDRSRAIESKEEYYYHFFGIYPEDPYWVEKVWKICYEYLRSLVFCLHYYLDKLPSWNYHYKYRVAPLPSDLSYFMKKRFIYDYRDINDLKKTFRLGKSYCPFEQLMLVLPVDNKILPESLNRLMKLEKLREFYPDDFSLDIVNGEKHIYAEPLLPELPDNLIIKEMSKIKLSKEMMLYNNLESKPYVYGKEVRTKRKKKNNYYDRKKRQRSNSSRGGKYSNNKSRSHKKSRH